MNNKQKIRNWPLKITLLIAIVGFAYSMNSMIAPEMYRSMRPPQLGYIFVPDDGEFTDGEHRIEVQFIQFSDESPKSVTAFIMKKPDDQPQELPLEPLLYSGTPTRTWFAVLPPLKEKGARWFYYLTIQTTKDRTIEIWKNMNWFERLFSGFSKDRQHFWVTYEGNVVRETQFGRILLISHIVLAFGALLFLFHTMYYILRLVQIGPSDIDMLKGYKSAFWAAAFFFTGAIVLGIPITYYTFNTGFAPWPVKGLFNLGDITDTKSTLLAVWWAILLISYYKQFRLAVLGRGDGKLQRKFGWWTILALFITVFVFLIPHSQFLQTSH
jgi:hypothetical protein